MEKLKEARELYGSSNVWRNDVRFSVNWKVMASHDSTMAKLF